MKKLKLFCVALAFILLMPYICYAQDSTDQTEVPFEDVSSTAPEFNGADEWTLPELTQAYELGLTTEKSMQKMSSSITREEFCELAVLFYEKYTGKEAAIPVSSPFKDTTNPTILKAVGLGITNGFTPTSFNPAGFISKQDMAVMIVRAMKAGGIDTSVTTKVTAFMDANKIGKNALSSVEALQERGVLKGEKYDSVGGTDRYKLEPQGSISKQEAIILLKRTFEYSCMVRNASKWGPEVYIPKLKFSDKYLYSEDVQVFENDLFDLKIAPKTPVDKNFEKRMYDIIKYMEAETGFLSNHNNTKKWQITADISSSYSFDFDRSIYSDGYSFSNTRALSPIADGSYEDQEIINIAFYLVLSNYSFNDKVSVNNTLINAIKKYAIIKIQDNYFDSEYLPPYKYTQGLLINEKKRFEAELSSDPELFFRNITNMETMGIYDYDFFPEMSLYSKAYYILFDYISETYGKNKLYLCFSDVVDATQSIFSDIDDLIYNLKMRTNKNLFNDFSIWYNRNKNNYDINNSNYFDRNIEPIYNEVSDIEVYHPDYIGNTGTNPSINVVSYFPQLDYYNNYKFVDDTITIDYTSAIATAQINGFEVKGISLTYTQIKKYITQGLTFEVYDANSDLIFKGPTDKLFPGITIKSGYMIFYGGVKIVLHTKPGTTIKYDDGSYVTSQLLVKQ
ncbi:MAG: S-layer homology domain-containing protein [Eubacteriales bacterium]